MCVTKHLDIGIADQWFTRCNRKPIETKNEKHRNLIYQFSSSTMQNTVSFLCQVSEGAQDTAAEHQKAKKVKF